MLNKDALAVDIAAYPSVYPLSLRWTDLDADRYLSELAVSRYAEQGRSELLVRAFGDVGIDLDNGALGMVVASLRVTFVSHRPVHGGIQLATGMSHIGRSSAALRIAVFDDHACLAVTDNVMVFVDRPSGKPTPIPERLLETLKGLVCRDIQ